MKLERRSVFGWPPTAAGWAPCKNGLVVHYDSIDQGLAGKSHDACRTYWRDTRRFHMGPARGWLDIGYSWACCPHGYVMEGRGWQRQQAAQPGGNSTWTSVTFATGPSEQPTAAQINAFRELRAWLRGKGLAAAVSYHSRFSSTSCPGAILRGMVTSGSLVTGSTPEPQAQEDDDMPTPKELWDHEIPVPWGSPDNPTWQADSILANTGARARNIEAKIDVLLARDGGEVDTDAIVRGLLTGLTPAAIAAAVADELPADLAKQVADELASRLQS
jgi:hypothetical protein